MPADDLRGAKRADRGRPSPRRQADTHGSPLCNDTRREGEGRCDARHGHFLFLPRLPSRGVSRVAAIGLALACSRPECSAQVVISDGVGGHIHPCVVRPGFLSRYHSPQIFCTKGMHLSEWAHSGRSCPITAAGLLDGFAPFSTCRLRKAGSSSTSTLLWMGWMGNQKVQSAKMRAP